MMSHEQARAAHSSTIWIASHIDFRYASDRELLQIIAQQPTNVWQGSARALAARWEAHRRGLLAGGRLSREESNASPPEQASQPRPRKRYVQQSEPDALLVSLLLGDPGATNLAPVGGEPLLGEESNASPPEQAPQPRPRKRYVQQPEADALLLSLLLDDPGGVS